VPRNLERYYGGGDLGARLPKVLHQGTTDLYQGTIDLYQGTTLVVPNRHSKNSRFSLCRQGLKPSSRSRFLNSSAGRGARGKHDIPNVECPRQSAARPGISPGLQRVGSSTLARAVPRVYLYRAAAAAPRACDAEDSSSNACGFLSAIIKSFRAAWRGRRTPCSQLWTVFVLTFSSRAN